MSEEKDYICVARTSNNRVVAAYDLYCCLLPQCEALGTCRSGFPMATSSDVDGKQLCENILDFKMLVSSRTI